MELQFQSTVEVDLTLKQEANKLVGNFNWLVASSSQHIFNAGINAKQYGNCTFPELTLNNVECNLRHVDKLSSRLSLNYESLPTSH